MKFGTRVQTWNFSQAKFCKNRLRGIPFLGKFIPKNTNFGDFGAVLPHFLTHNDEIWYKVQTWDSLPKPNFVLKKSLKGIYPFWGNFYQRLPISPILGAVSTHFKSDNGEICREGTNLGHSPSLLIL